LTIKKFGHIICSIDKQTVLYRAVERSGSMVNSQDTKKGTLLENFYPSGWDFDKIDKCVGRRLKLSLKGSRAGIRTTRLYSIKILTSLKLKWITKSPYTPALPGKLFFIKELAGPLVPECN
jgi:hypothetical protein